MDMSSHNADNDEPRAPYTPAQIDIFSLGQMLTAATCELYGGVLSKLGVKLSGKYLKDASQEEKDSFVKRLKDTQMEKLTDRLTLLMNRVLADHYFLKSYDEIMGPFKSLEELRQDNEIANNHLQSVENERSILQRDSDMAIDKLEALCESILVNKLINLNTVNNDDT